MPSPRSDRGSLLLLQIFLILAAATAVAIISDVGRVIGVRQSLAATADQAAIAGAQAIHLDSYFSRGGQGLDAVALDPAEVTAAVRRQLAPAIAAQQEDGLQLAAVDVAGGVVGVRLACRARLPFASLIGVESVPVRASAQASLLLSP